MIDRLYLKGIQKLLKEKVNAKLTVDGKLGPKSAIALKQYQIQNNLKPSGIYDPNTQKVSHDLIINKYITSESIRLAANELGVTMAHINAVCDVESKGSGFLSNGKPSILFERHWFIKIYKSKHPDTCHVVAINNPDICNTRPGGYIGGLSEYTRFDKAYSLDPYCAIYSTSFGLFQVMGFNHRFAGYDFIEDFYKAMNQSEMNHLMAFINFNKTYRNGELMNALKNNNWARYAQIYNGPDYKKNNYDEKLKSAYIRNGGK